MEASSNLTTQADDLDKLYNSVRGFVFFGVPHGGSQAFKRLRVNILEMMAKAVFKEIPSKLRSALQSGSDELLDLADRFRTLSLTVENKLIIVSFYENVTTAGLGDRVMKITRQNSSSR